MVDTGSQKLNILNKRELISISPYFAGLSEPDISIVEGLTTEEHYDRDAIVLHEGHRSRKLYLVASGAVKVFETSADGKEQIVAITHPADSFNDVAAFDGGETQSAAQALTPIILYAVNGRILLEKSCELGPLAANIIRALGARVRQLGALVSDLSFRPVAGRLAKILLTQINNPSMPYLTQKDMASMAGTAREVVARALKGMEDEGIITVDRHRIEIMDRAALEHLAI
jgi:CRP/FNR family transcriptional regulator